MKNLLFLSLVILSFGAFASGESNSHKETIYDGADLQSVSCARDSALDRFSIDTHKMVGGFMDVRIDRVGTGSGLRYEVYINGNFRHTCNNISMYRTGER